MDLSTLKDPCKVYPTVNSVQGIPATSASATDMYILTCKPHVHYNRKSVDRIFVKLSVSAPSITPQILEQLEPFLPEKPDLSKQALLYKRLSYSEKENGVYQDVKRIYTSHMCPFFIRVYGIATECTYKSVGKMLGEAQRNFKRNIWYSLTNRTERPAIHEDTKDSGDSGYEDFDPHKKLRFNMLFLQYIDQPEFLQLLTSGHYLNNPTLFYKMLFMVGFACYSLNLHSICHKDLHLRNVLVEQCGEKELTVVVETKAYRFSVTEFPRLFDFDRSDTRPCSTSAQDLFYFVTLFAHALDPEERLKLVKCFVNPFGRGVRAVKEYWDVPMVDRRSEDTTRVLLLLEPLPKVLHALSSHAQLDEVRPVGIPVTVNNLFVARRALKEAPNVRDAFFQNQM